MADLAGVRSSAAPFRIQLMLSDKPWVRGSGRRMLRHWMREQPCCDAARLASLPDGRLRCGSCGMWFSASHSAPVSAALDGGPRGGGDGLPHAVLAIARAPVPVGIDVQFPQRRAAAMRWLARVSGLQSRGVHECTLEHWALAEAQLKATGCASRLPRAGELWLPDVVAERGEFHWRVANRAHRIRYETWPVVGARVAAVTAPVTSTGTPISPDIQTAVTVFKHSG